MLVFAPHVNLNCNLWPRPVPHPLEHKDLCQTSNQGHRKKVIVDMFISNAKKVAETYLLCTKKWVNNARKNVKKFSSSGFLKQTWSLEYRLPTF